MEKCKQCGTCCRKGGPALHSQDLALIRESGIIDIADLVTLRKGELAYDQPAGKVQPLEEEIVKIRGTGVEWTCKFFAPESNACRIYHSRPIECQLLFCEDPDPLMEIYDKDRITRKDLLPEGHPLLELAQEHDEKCSPLKVAELSAIITEADKTGKEAPEATSELAEILSYDRSMRELVAEKTGIPESSLDFLFGRALTRILPTFGLSAASSGRGFTLRVNKRS